MRNSRVRISTNVSQALNSITGGRILSGTFGGDDVLAERARPLSTFTKAFEDLQYLRTSFSLAEEVGKSVDRSEVLQRAMPKEQEPMNAHQVRLILGDQLNSAHSWYEEVDDRNLYVMMEMRQETDYALHHVQKVLGFFAAMRNFAEALRKAGHRVLYLNLDDPRNKQALTANLDWIIALTGASAFAYQLPDKYQIDEQLEQFSKVCGCSVLRCDTEHFISERSELANLFEGRKQYLMERFYRVMRERTGLLMNGDLPAGSKWNYDKENRGRPAEAHVAPPPLLFDHDLCELQEMIHKHGVKTIGTVNAKHFPWPVDRSESLSLLEYFCENVLLRSGIYQDALMPGQWALYHARLSCAMNLKLISPLEVCLAAEAAWKDRPTEISLAQVEGFIRQIIGWREYMRGTYWAQMPRYASLNFFGHHAALPEWFWTGNTKMACMREAITGSLTNAYEHHIQRLMVTGNFALLAGVDPDELDQWYLGIYIDAIEWVEITNTRGMSQFADGGLVGTKPYVSSGAYINKMGHHCGTCFYNVKDRTGPRACPFNALYWYFHARNRERLESPEARPGTMMHVGMVYRTWEKMDAGKGKALLDKGDDLLANIETL